MENTENTQLSSLSSEIENPWNEDVNGYCIPEQYDVFYEYPSYCE